MRHSWGGSAARPPWVVPKGKAGKEGNRRSGRKPDQGSGGRGDNGSSTRETAVDESRKWMAARIARHQADY